MNFIGQGTDIHKIKKTTKQTKIVLGGYEFFSNHKIVAHSDGDVVLHSIANAILGCTQSGDIGDYFSDEHKSNKDINSRLIIQRAIQILNTKKQRITNIDLTIICEKIMLLGIKREISASLKQITKCENINVKATRFEKKINYIQCESIVLTTTI